MDSVHKMKEMNMLWNIYTLHSASESLNGVMLRGRIRKFGLVNKIVVLAENAEDEENGVRIALLSDVSARDLPVVTEFLKRIIPDIQITEELREVGNPILSKIKCNDESRYTI